MAMIVLMLFFPLGDRPGDAGLFVFVVLNGQVKGVGPQVGTMEFVFRQAFQGFRYGFVGYFLGLLDGFALGHLGEHAGYGNGRPTAEGLEFDVFDRFFFDL